MVRGFLVSNIEILSFVLFSYGTTVKIFDVLVSFNVLDKWYLTPLL